jgi:hypothetical protein
MTGNPHHDLNLKTELEIVITPDGKVKKITVVKGSNLIASKKMEITTDGMAQKIKVEKGSSLLTWDAAAINAVYEGEPYNPPPDIIKSYDGNVYFRWEFYREPGKCGPLYSNAYILTGPGEKKIKVKKAPKEKAPADPTNK